MDERRWGFEEAEDWEYNSSRNERSPAGTPDLVHALVGQDADQVVRVAVSPEAEVVAVRLSPNWRRAIDPRGLNANVLSAANSATMLALARKVAEIDLTGGAELPPREAVNSDDSPLAAQDVQRLVDEVSSELNQFAARTAAVAERQVHVRSAGGHVEGVAQRGHVLSLEIDTNWTAQARHTEIETELLDVLRTLHRDSTPQASAVPGGRAISELLELASNPERLMKRLGLPAGEETPEQHG